MRRIPKDIQDDIIVEASIVCGSYEEGTTDPTPVAVDTQTAHRAELFVDVSTLVSNELVVKLQEADKSDGSYTDVTDYDDDVVKVTIDETGQFKVDARNTKRYLKAVATQDTGDTDIFGAYIIAANLEKYPAD